MIEIIGRGPTARALKELGHETVGEANLERVMAAVASQVPLLVVLDGVEGLPEQLDAFGQRVAEIASAATAPTRVIVDQSQPVLWQSLRNWIYPPSLLVEVERLEKDLVLAEAASL